MRVFVPVFQGLCFFVPVGAKRRLAVGKAGGRMEREGIEDIILRHSQRGMQKLRPHLPKDYCRQAAEEIASWERGVVFLTTGFYVAGYPETDGPTASMPAVPATFPFIRAMSSISLGLFAFSSRNRASCSGS